MAAAVEKDVSSNFPQHAPPKAVTAREPEQLDASDGEGEDKSDGEQTEDKYDVLESTLCGEYSQDTQQVNMSQGVKNQVKNAQRAAHKASNIGLCQDTRATTEQVLDPRTRLILFKLLQRTAFAKLEGCLSTGKEANVYFALSGDGMRDIEATKDVPTHSPLAVKVYKTSILVFRDRRRYVDGEHRFEKGYTSGKNPRKMVQLWAEKELRNYKRLHAHNVRTPRPLLLKGHVLVMEFIGTNGWPAPRLHDVTFNKEQMEDAYVQTCVALRAMFARCKLVHGDFSEYNLLWHEGQVVVIDVSQSVEWDHPRATEFLRKDCANVKSFFGSKVDRVLSVKALYDFVMKDGQDEDDNVIRTNLEEARDLDTATDQEDRVFIDAFLPRSLADLGSFPEAAQKGVETGDNETGFNEAVSDLLGENVESDEESDDTKSWVDDDTEFVSGRLPDPSDVAGRSSAKEAKRAASKLQKEERREKRKTKMKKHLKKAATKRGR